MELIVISFLFLGVLLILYAIGVPVAIAMVMTSVGVMLSPYGPEFSLSMISNQFLFGVNSFSLIALPLYIVLGRLMNRSGFTEDLFNFANALVGHFRGGVIYVNIVASMIFSGMSGLAAADAAGLGRVEYRAMRDRDYGKSISIGVTGSSAIIGPIIPPSVPIIIYAVIAQQSIGAMFLAGVIPGILLGVVLMLFSFLLIRLKGYGSDRSFALRDIATGFVSSLPALFIPVFIIVGILSGIFTATEAGAIAVVYAIVVPFAIGDLDTGTLLEELKSSTVEAFSLSFIVAAASVYGLVALRLQIPMLLADAITGISTDPTIVIILIMGMFLVIGSFMNVIPAMIVVLPLLLPILSTLNIDLVHFGIVLILTLMMGLLTPPVGMVLFVLDKVTDATFEEIVKGVVPYYIPLLATILILIFVPELITYVPYNLTG